MLMLIVPVDFIQYWERENINGTEVYHILSTCMAVDSNISLRRGLKCFNVFKIPSSGSRIWKHKNLFLKITIDILMWEPFSKYMQRSHSSRIAHILQIPSLILRMEDVSAGHNLTQWFRPAFVLTKPFTNGTW